MYSYCMYMYFYCYVCEVLSLCCFVYCLCVNVYLQLPPGLNPIAISTIYHIQVTFFAWLYIPSGPRPPPS